MPTKSRINKRRHALKTSKGLLKHHMSKPTESLTELEQQELEKLRKESRKPLTEIIDSSPLLTNYLNHAISDYLTRNPLSDSSRAFLSSIRSISESTGISQSALLSRLDYRVIDSGLLAWDSSGSLRVIDNVSYTRDLRRVQDLSKEEQTDELKYELYNMILPFVRKYQPHYYPQYKGDLEDLAADYYIDFMTPKSRIKGQEQSLLDKFDPSITILPYLVKTSVIRKLIDGARTDKGEINYDENYDEDSTKLSIDFLRGDLTDEEIEQIEDMEFDEEFLDTLVAKYHTLSAKEKKAFLSYYQEVKSVISPNFRNLFEQAALDKPYKGTIIAIEGKAPSFHVIRSTKGEHFEETIRARNIESVKSKLLKNYPGAVIQETPIKDSCRQFFSKDFLRIQDSLYRRIKQIRHRS